MSNPLGYSPKDLHFGESGRSKLITGITKLASAVKSTLGPSGNTVIIESVTHTHGITVTKDGVTVAKSIDLLDPVQNLAVKIMKEAADRTATEAGDGTTTAIVLTEQMVLGGTIKMVEGVNRTEVLRKLSELTAEVVDKIKELSQELTDKDLFDVATISANNDESIGKIIAEVYGDVGREGVVTVEKSKTAETYAETTMGLKVARGFSSPMFINDHRKDECVFEDTMVLVSDIEISNILQIEMVLKPIIQEGKRLLIIAPCHANVLNTLAANVVKNSLKVCVVQPPNFGYKQHELMQDIAVSVGATYFSEKTGDDFSHVNFADLGHAARIIAGRDSTIIIKSDARAKQEVIDERVEQLKAAYAEATKKADKDFLAQRIASLTGGIGVIYVGGNTDLEQKELYDRVDDAVCAVRSALEEGVLPGAGIALFVIARQMQNDLELSVNAKELSREKLIASEILFAAMRAPLVQILDNAGLRFEDTYGHIDFGLMPFGFGFDVKKGEYNVLHHNGVVDPAKVTRSALQNAVSVATTILSTNAIITMGRSYETQ